jgi:uncharacterized membrane protein YphA (DoxX/SURF4 family)
MNRWLLLGGRLILAGIFLYAGYEKIREPWLQFAVSIEGFKIVPDSLLEPMSKTLPWLEVIAGVGLLVDMLAPWAALATTLMLVVFNTAGTWAYAKGLKVDCGCFGAGSSDGIDAKWFAEHLGMLLLGVVVTAGCFLMRRGKTAEPENSPAAASLIA